MKLPDSFAGLFRNYIFETIDDERHHKLIIKTVLAHGTWEQIMWLFRHYGREKVKAVFLDDYHGLRTLPDVTLKLWELLFADKPLPEDGDPAAKWRCRRIVASSPE